MICPPSSGKRGCQNKYKLLDTLYLPLLIGTERGYWCSSPRRHSIIHLHLRFSHSSKSGRLRRGFPSGPIRAAFCALIARAVNTTMITNSLGFIMWSLRWETAILRPLCEPLSLSLMSSDSHRQLDRIRRSAIATSTALALARSLARSPSHPVHRQVNFGSGSPDSRFALLPPARQPVMSVSYLAGQGAPFPLFPLWHDFTFLFAVFGRRSLLYRPLVLPRGDERGSKDTRTDRHQMIQLMIHELLLFRFNSFQIIGFTHQGSQPGQLGMD